MSGGLSGRLFVTSHANAAVYCMYRIFSTETSVAEPPLFWAAPEVLSSGADSGQVRSSAAPDRKKFVATKPENSFVCIYDDPFLDCISLFFFLFPLC